MFEGRPHRELGGIFKSAVVLLQIVARKSVSRCRGANVCQLVKEHLYSAVTASLKCQRGRGCDCAPEQVTFTKTKTKTLVATSRGRPRHIETSKRPQQETDSLAFTAVGAFSPRARSY